MRKTWWSQGGWKCVCDSCGLFFKSDELRLRWDGLMVDALCWETRQPQELIRPIPDQPAPPWTRPDVQPTYWYEGNNTPGCTVVTGQGVADVGTADCARADINLGQT